MWVGTGRPPSWRQARSESSSRPNNLSYVGVQRPQRASLTLEQAIDAYLRERTAFQTMEEDTRENYERLLRHHVYPTLGARPVTRIQRDDLARVFEGLLT